MHSHRDYVVLGLGVVGAAVMAWALRGDPLFAAVSAAFVAVGTWLSIIDFNEHRLPNRIVVPTAGAVTVAVFVLGVVENDLGRALRAVLTALAVFVVLFVAGLLGGIGMGDVKFSYPVVALLAWSGTAAIQVAAFTTIVVAGVYTAGVLARSRTLRQTIAFGPFMTVGLIVGLAVNASL